MSLFWNLLVTYAMPVISLLGGLSGFYAFIASGSRVKVETYFAVHNGNSMLRVTSKHLDEFPFSFLTQMSRPVLVVRARNTGRSPISVEVVEVVSKGQHSIPFMGKSDKGAALPASLMPGTSEYWIFDLRDVLEVSEYVETEKPGFPIRAVVSLANNKTPKTKWISHAEITEYKDFWLSILGKVASAEHN